MCLPRLFKLLLCVAVTFALALSNLAMAQQPPDHIGVSPTGREAIQLSLDEDNLGLPSNVTPVDADDLSRSTPGIDGMDYIYQTVDSALAPSPPVGYHNAVLNPFDLGLRRNTQQPGPPPQTHKDEVNALSYGQDVFYTDGDLVGFPGFGANPPLEPYMYRDGFPDPGEPRVVGGTRANIDFSVDVHAKGAPGTGVAGVVAGPHPMKPSSHVYLSSAPNTNSVLFTDTQLGIFMSDDVDAYENVPDEMPALGHPDELGMPNPAPSRTFFAADNETVGHNPALTLLPNAVNTQAGLGEASGDIFVGIGGGNLLLIDEGQLGLWPGLAVGGFDDADDLDALALNILLPDTDIEVRMREAMVSFDPANPHTGYGITIPLLNRDEAEVLFSVEEGSIGIFGSAVDFEHRINPSEESGDLFYSNLFGQNWLSYEATNLGLLESDELDALDTRVIPEPGTLAMLAAVALLGLLSLVWKRRKQTG